MANPVNGFAVTIPSGSERRDAAATRGKSNHGSCARRYGDAVVAVAAATEAPAAAVTPGVVVTRPTPRLMSFTLVILLYVKPTRVNDSTEPGAVV